MITGFNSDVKYRGLVYHVQPEDKGQVNPLIETLIYRGGEILASRRLPYAEMIEGQDAESAISRLMEEQRASVGIEPHGVAAAQLIAQIVARNDAERRAAVA